MNYSTKASAVPTFGEASRPYIDAGIDARDLLPVIPPKARISSKSEVVGGKTPGQYDPTADNWRGLRGSHFTKGLSDDTLHDCSKWPTGNVGIRGAVISAVDSDVQTNDARRLVVRVIEEFAGRSGPDFAVRRRGTGPRQLYAFRPHGTVRSRPGAVKFTLPSDPKDMPKPHEVEVKGEGGHWVAAGVHPSGEPYEWDPEADLCEMLQDRRIIELGEADVERILDGLVKVIEAAGGTVVSRGSGKGASGNGGELRNYSRDDPVMPVEAILRGLDRLPNTRAHFSTHDSLVVMLGAVRAALGCEADSLAEDVRAWVTAHEDDTGADDAYFDRVWDSLDAGVRVDRDSLDRRFRRERIFVSADADFPDDDVAADSLAADAKWETSTAAKKVRLLREIAARLVFAPVDTAAGEAFPQIRSRGRIDGQEKGRDWWAGKSLLSDETVLNDLHAAFGKDELGFWRFFRALASEHADCIFRALVKNPLVDVGQMVEFIDKQGNAYYELNTLALPPAQKMGARLPKGSGSPDGNADVAIVIDLMRRTFGEFVDFELDVLGFMAQKKKRVGNGLVLHGDQGTGKSTYTKMLSGLFNGVGEANYIPGNKLKGDDRGFYLVALEGARILEVQELPSDMKADAKATFESLVKQVIDSSSAGDTVKIEGKHENARPVTNYARFVMTTNHLDAIKVSVDDRRLFYVSSGITRENKPDKAWWKDLNAILGNPKRMAYFWRYLLDRNVEEFDHHQAPPVTRAKLARQITSEPDPVTRHMHAVMIALKGAGRKLVDTAEVRSLLYAAACNEARSTKQQVDDRDAYTPANWKPGRVKKAFTLLGDNFVVLQEMKKDGSYFGKMYVARGHEFEKALMGAKRQEVTDARDRDRDDNRLTEDHWPAGYEGPLHADAKGADDFD